MCNIENTIKLIKKAFETYPEKKAQLDQFIEKNGYVAFHPTIEFIRLFAEKHTITTDTVMGEEHGIVEYSIALDTIYGKD